MSGKIAYIADSCADLPAETLARDDVFVLPVVVSVRGEEHLDGEDITAEDIYRLQREGEMPATSLPSGAVFERVFGEVIGRGFTRAVVVTMSSAISGTWNACRLVCSEIEKLESVVFDSGMASLAEGALLVEIIDEVEAGKVHWEQIPERLAWLKERTCPFFGIDTLEFLQKTGRIGKAKALAGNLLSIMPILSFNENGEITTVEMTRGKKKRLERLKDLALEKAADMRHFRLYFVDGGCHEWVAELKNDVLGAIDTVPKVLTSALGCALSVHLGPNLVGVCVQDTDV